MFDLLFKIFVRNYKDINNAKVRSQCGLICGYIGIFLNLILFLIKLFAGIISNSVSITADSFNNLSDSASSVISIIGFKFSIKPPDKEHPLGHGRYEYISSLIISFLVIFVGASFLKSSFEKILMPEQTSFNLLLFLILIISILIKLFICILNFHISKKTNSQILKATALDSLYDSIITTLIIISTTISIFMDLHLDGYAGVIVSGFIIYSGIKLIKETLSTLIGEAPSDELVSNLKNNILKFDNILGLHDLMVHNYGPNKIVASIHAEVPSDLSLINVHNLIDRIEKEIEKEMGIHLVIHIDPVDVHNKENLEIYENITSLIKSNITQVNKIIDFRILNIDGKNTIYFEIKIKNEFYNDDASEILKDCLHLVNTIYPDFDCKIFKNSIMS